MSLLLHKQLLSPYLAVKTSGEWERLFEKEALLKSIAFTDLWGNRLVILLSPQHLQLSITVQWIWHSICQTRALVRPLRGTVGTGETCTHLSSHHSEMTFPLLSHLNLMQEKHFSKTLKNWTWSSEVSVMLMHELTFPTSANGTLYSWLLRLWLALT